MESKTTLPSVSVAGSEGESTPPAPSETAPSATAPAAPASEEKPDSSTNPSSAAPPASDGQVATAQESDSANDGSVSKPRALPPIPPQTPDATETEIAGGESETTEKDEEEDLSAWKRKGPLPEEIAAAAFKAPPGATPLSKTSRLWIDRKRPRVYIDGYVAMKQGPLEMFACPVATKEHESIVAVLARSREVHAALLAVGAKPGTPVRFRPEFKPPSGQSIQVWACWYDKQGKFHCEDGRQWVMDLETEKAMDADWIFAGSGFWKDPEDKQEYYRADSGDMICVSNFSSAMIDVAMASSAEADSLRFVPFEENIPDRETPIRLVLVPRLDIPQDDPKPTPDENMMDRPKADDVPRAK